MNPQFFNSSRTTATPTPGKKVLMPQDPTFLLVDLESMMAFSEKSVDPIVLNNNAGLVANTGAKFKVPTILATVAPKESGLWSLGCDGLPG